LAITLACSYRHGLFHHPVRLRCNFTDSVERYSSEIA
jgi:hypothetical protein